MNVPKKNTVKKSRKRHRSIEENEPRKRIRLSPPNLIEAPV